MFTLRVNHLFAAAFLAGSLVGCGAVKRAAANDPMKCEQDPNCSGKYSGSRDCYTQCVDNPECISRCRQVSGQK